MNSLVIAQDDNIECRVCRAPSTDDDPLYCPCLCRGSIKWVHQSCLQDWLQHRPRSDALCELCKHAFSFTPIYAPDAPSTLTWTQVTTDLFKMVAVSVPSAFRFLVVSCAWLILVPLLTRILLRACFRLKASWLLSPSQILTILPSPLTLLTILTDFQSGVLLCSAIFITVAIAAVFRELIPADNVPPVGLGVDVPPAPAADLAIVNPEVLGNQIPPRLREDFNELEPGIFIEDMPLWQWLGFSGHWTIFVTHFCSVLLCNFMFLFGIVFFPFRVGKFFLDDIFHVTCTELITTLMNSVDTLFQSVLARPLFPDGAQSAIIEGLTYNPDMEDFTIIAVGLIYIALLTCLLLVFPSALGNTWTANLARSLRSILYQTFVCWKVSIFLAIELVACPIFFGMAIDFMTIDIRRAAASDRYEAFMASPFFSSLVYWVIGIALFLELSIVASVLRQTIRRDVYLLLFRDPDDPDFHPVQELIDKPVLRLCRSLVLSFLIYLVLLVLFLHIPSRIAIRAIPSLAPLNLRFTDATEIPTDFVFLHFCLPFVVERVHMGRRHIKFAELWFRWMCRLLSLTDVILSPPSDSSSPQNRSPSHLTLRVFALFLLAWLTFLMLSSICIFIPLLTGRMILASVPYHDVYAFLVGCNFYFIIGWCLEQLYSIVHRRDMARLVTIASKWGLFVAKLMCICLGGGFLLPLFAGLLFDLVVIVPLRVPFNESPVIFFTQDWAMGLVGLKIWARLLHVGFIPSAHWKEKIQRVERMGVNGLDVILVLTEVVWPLLSIIGVHLLVPYVFSQWLYPWYDDSLERQEIIYRLSFAIFANVRVLAFVVAIISRWYSNLEKSLFNDRYLVGQRLVNRE